MDDEIGLRAPVGDFWRPRVLIADDDPDCLEGFAGLLGGRYEVETARDGQEALDRLRAAVFDLAILDQHIPGWTGLQVAEALTLDSRALPSFLFVSGDPGVDLKVRGLSMGDFVAKPVEPAELLARAARMIATARRERSLVADTLSDPLTGLANYRSLARSLNVELARARRYDQPLSLLTIDLDDLKGINDTFGHGAGNDALRVVASVLAGAVRKFEVVARHGGDELAILMPSATGAEAMKLAERLCAEVSRRSIRGRALSISIGVSSRERGDQEMTVQDLVDASDEALYRSKCAGRSRVSGAPRSGRAGSRVPSTRRSAGRAWAGRLGVGGPASTRGTSCHGDEIAPPRESSRGR